MPTYEYRCKNCDHGFDIVQSFSDDSLTECPECEGALKKVFGNVGIAFKGSGFYKTDSRSSSGTKATSDSGSSSDTKSETSSDSGSKTDSSSSTKTDSKPASSDSKSSGDTKKSTASAAAKD